MNKNVFSNKTCYVGLERVESYMLLFPQGHVDGGGGGLDRDNLVNPRPKITRESDKCARRRWNCYEAWSWLQTSFLFIRC